MSHTVRNLQSWACGLVASLALGACGGGGSAESGAQPIAQALAQSISFPALTDRKVGEEPLTLAATPTSGLAVTFASTTPAVCTVNGSAVNVIAAGTCSVTASQAGNATYAAALPVTNTFTVAPADQAITFVSPGNQTLGSAPIALVASATSGLLVSFESNTPAVCTVSGATLTLVAAGTCTVVARQAGDANFLAAGDCPQSFEVAGGLLAQTITFASPGTQALGASAVPLSATASSGLAVSFASLTPSVCTVSGTALTLLSAGTCTVAASQPGDSVYAAATAVSNSFAVGRTAQAITFDALGNQALGTAPAPLAASSSSGLPVALASTTPGVCTVTGNTLNLAAVGTCSIDASQAGSAAFAPATTVTRTFSVVAGAPLAQTITFASPGNQTLGTAPPALVASASSGLPVSFASATPGTCTVSGSTLTLVALGTCTVDANQGGNSAYLAAPTVSRSFQVVAAPLTAQTITFASPGNQTLGTAPPALVASASSGLAVSFASTTTGVCTVSGSTLTLLSAGTCTINANQAGNASFSAAPQVSNTFSVAAAPLLAQSITFASPGNQTLGVTPPALVASASSGLAVSLASTSPSVCTVSGTTLSLVAAGNCTLTASQSGNGVFAAASPVQVTFTVAAAAAVNMIANGGFEIAPAIFLVGTQPGPGGQGSGYWLTQGGSGAATLSSDARTGAFSASVTCPQLCASTLFGNSVDNGGRLPISPSMWGTSPTFSFWAKGEAGTTGNMVYALRYLDAVGNILGQTPPGTNLNSANPTTWTRFSVSIVVPNGTTAVFFETTYQLGPVGVQPSGLVFTGGGFKIDDIQLVP